MKKILLILASLVFLTGCSMFNVEPTPDPVPIEDLPTYDPIGARTGIVRRALVVGLTAVDPAAYGGWSGACPGCDVDSEIFAQLCLDQGVEAILVQNEQATKGNLIAKAAEAWEGMSDNDLFVFFISGHGGQIKDLDGDEDDVQDETLCLWDGELSDDVLRALWDEIPAGVRVLFITDTCNSGSNYKSRSYIKSLPRNYTGSLIHYGGCADGESSYGSEQGGNLTTAIIDAWDPLNSYQEWFNDLLEFMPRNQIPIYEEYGSVGAFRDMKALQ